MELMDAIRGRRSIRKYTNQPVPRDILEKCLEAATWAPSGQNLQPWYFVAVTKPEDLAFIFAEMGHGAYSHRKKLEARFKNNPEVVEETLEFMEAMGGASTLVLAFLRKPNYSDEDMSSCIESVAAAMENFCLAAYDFGLGTCWIEEIIRTGDSLQARFAPDKGRLLGAIVVGYPGMEAKAPKRKDTYEII